MYGVSEEGTTTAILAYNLTDVPENEYLLTGMKIEKFNEKGFDKVRLEFGIQKATGTMAIRNPQLLSSPPASSVSFPFNIPSDASCNLSINTSEFHPFENDLLSTNSHFTWASYSWDDTEVVNLINTHFPMTNMRFPGGTVGNFYNYSTDGFYNDIYAQTNGSAVNGFNKGFTFGYDGYKTLSLANNASSTLMFNVISDDVATSKNRLQSRLNDGLNVEWIELGNENFFSAQSLGNVDNLTNYIAHTKALSTGLKQINATVKVALNIDHHNYSSGSWSASIASENYYDALVVHPYVSTNTFLLNKLSAYKMMSAYKITTERLADFKRYFPDKPMLCTEWNVLSDGIPVNFIQTLSIADLFLALERGNEEGIVKQAGIHMLYHSDKYSEATLSYYDETSSKMKLTANGIFYASLFKTFKSGNVFDAYSVSETLEENLPGVIAKAVEQGDYIKVFIVNKLPVISPLNIEINSKPFQGSYTIETFHEDINQTLTSSYSTYEEAWDTSTSNGQINVPAYSISVVTIAKSETILGIHDFDKMEKILVFPNPAKNSLQIKSSKNVKQVSLYSSLGQLVLKENTFNGTLNISSFSNGIYILKITFEDLSVISKKIIITP